MADLLLAIVHHGLAFGLAALLAAELVMVRPGLSAADLPMLGRIDATYGGLAAAIVVVGIGRLLFGLKGWEYYVHNPIFWCKMGAFAVVGVLSIPPTIRILAWRRASSAGAASVPETEIVAMRRYLRAEAAVFAFILVFAAAMARGYGA